MITEIEEPQSLLDAYERKRILVAEIEEIQAQLGDRARRLKSDYETFYTWRQQAKWALTVRLQELRLIKKWINDHQDNYAESETIT